MQILERLQRSRFRSKFKLDEREKIYLKDKGNNVIRDHAYSFFSKRLKVRLKNDGKQTPWKGHPVFTAQHATATCCRECLEKWHKIPKNKILDENELRYCVDVVMSWIDRQ